jgi:NifB/MoaA-like Fe-S oxidoreductase
MAPHLRELGARIAEVSGAEIRIVPVVNGLYGPLVTTAGLLGGRDHLRALEPVRDWDAALITRTALNDEGLFLDDMTLEELRHELPEMQIWPSEHVTDVLLDL